MTYYILYEDGSTEEYTPSITQTIGTLTISDALFALYTKLYVQDFRVAEFKKWWSPTVCGSLNQALYTSQLPLAEHAKEIIRYSVAMDRTKTVELFLAIDGDVVFFIHPSKTLRANKVTTPVKWPKRDEVIAE